MVVGYLERSGTSALLNTMKSNNFNQFIALCFVVLAQSLFLFLFSSITQFIMLSDLVGRHPGNTKSLAKNAAVCVNTDPKAY